MFDQIRFFLTTNQFTATPRVRKAFLVGITLMAVSELSGSFTIVNFAGPMFKASGSTVDPNFSSFCLGGIQILGTLATLCLIDKMGRRILLIVSTVGVALGTFVVGMYSLFYSEGYYVKPFDFTPVVSLSFTIFVACIGIIPIPYILAAELFPPKVRWCMACRFSSNPFSAFLLFFLNTVGYHKAIFGGSDVFNFVIFKSVREKSRNAE